MGGLRIMQGNDFTGVARIIACDLEGATVSVSSGHWNTHVGRHYYTGHVATLDAGEKLEFRWRTPVDHYMHVLFETFVSTGATIILYKDSKRTHNAANALSAFNRNHASTTQSAIQQLCHTPGGVESGATAFPTERVGGSKGVGQSRAVGEQILDLNTVYTLVITADSNGTDVSFIMDWYETLDNEGVTSQEA